MDSGITQGTTCRRPQPSCSNPSSCLITNIGPRMENSLGATVAGGMDLKPRGAHKKCKPPS